MSRTRKKSSTSRLYAGKLTGTTFTYYTPSFSNLAQCTDELHRGPPYRSGGPLSISKRKVTYGLSRSVTTKKYSGSYVGSFYAADASSGYSHVAPNDASYGAVGWARAAPVKPVLKLANFLVELRDVPRMLRSTQKMLSSFRPGGSNFKIGDAWLNYHFGWKLFLQDLYRIVYYGEEMNRRISYLRRNNGQSIRKRVQLKSESNSEFLSKISSSVTTLQPVTYSQAYDTSLGPYEQTLSRVNGHSIWFEAKFRYYIPRHDFDPGTLGLRARLAGLVPDISAVYNAIPWTWLIDYFTNAGSVLQNYAAFVQWNTVAPYAYLMSTFTRKYTTSGSCGVFLQGGGSALLQATTSSEWTWKTRAKASPFGFGITGADLSAYQWSILIALGLTRFER